MVNKSNTGRKYKHTSTGATLKIIIRTAWQMNDSFLTLSLKCTQSCIIDTNTRAEVNKESQEVKLERKKVELEKNEERE